MKTKTNEDKFHVPVLLEESIDLLITDQSGIYIDATYGGGGHSKRILQRITANGRLFGFDQDGAVFQNLIRDDRFEFVFSNFEYISRYMHYFGITQVDGIIADLGVSSHHLDDLERGFSIRSDADLDMRMNKANSITAQSILNSYSETDLVRLFSEFGEVRNAKTLAKALVNQRARTPFSAIELFTEFLQRYIIGDRHRYMVQVFQALRIEVNRELKVLKSLLIQAAHLLKTGGRVVVLSYHSLEDRLVKNYFKGGNFEGVRMQDDFGKVDRPFRELVPKLVLPSEEEIEKNRRAASAKMRVAERILKDDE